MNTEEDTYLLGKKLGSILPRGAFVALHGNLGAGKTVLVRGMASAFGIDHVTSPTFTIVQEYDTEPQLMHFDVYRLADMDELLAIGFEDYVARNGIIVMEWAELVSEILPEGHLSITLEGEGMLPRRMMAEGDSPWAMEVISAL